MATEKVRVLGIDTKSAQTSVGELRKKIKDLRSELLNLDKGTEEYKAKAKELGDSMHSLVEIQEAAKYSTADFGQKMSNVSSVIGAASASVAGLTSVLSLLGIEGGKTSEEVTKMITSFMAIAQAASSIDTAKKAFNGLAQAIGTTQKALGIWGIALTAVGAILAGVVSKIKEHRESLELQRDDIKKTIALIDEQNQKLKEQTSRYDELNKAMNERLELLNKTVNLDYSSLIEEEKKRLKNLEDDLKNAHGDYAKQLQEDIKKSKATIAEYQQLLKGVVGNTRKTQTTTRVTIKDTTDYLHLIERLRMSELELLEDDLAIATTIQSKAKEGTQEWNKWQYEIEKAKIKIEEFKKLLENQTFDAGPMSDPEEYWKNWYNAQLKAADNIYDSMRIATAEGDFESQLEIEKAYIDRRRELYQAMYEQQMMDKEEFDAKMIELDEQSLNVQKTLHLEYTNAISDISSSLAGTLSSLSSCFEESSAEFKALKIAETIISTLTSIMKTWEGYASMGPLGIAGAAAQTAMLATTGATTIAKIAKVDVSGKSNNTSGAVSTPRYSINSQATNAITTDYQKSQLEQISQHTAEQRNQRVYVVSSDIAESLNSRRVRVQSNTY